MRRFPTFSSESLQGCTVKGLFNCTGLGGKTVRISKTQTMLVAPKIKIQPYHAKIQDSGSQY